MKYDFTKFKLKDIAEKEIKSNNGQLPPHEIIGNEVWLQTKELPLSEIGKLIFNGKQVEISNSQMEKIKEIVETFIKPPFFGRQFSEFVEKDGKP